MSSDEDAERRIRRIQQEIVAASGAAQAMENARRQIVAASGAAQAVENARQQIVAASGAAQAMDNARQQIVAASGAAQAVESALQQVVAASGAAQAVESVRQQIAAPTVQLAEAMSRLERMAAPSSQFLAAVAQMQRTVMPPGHSLDTATQGSMRRITEMVAARAQSRADDVLARIGDLASSGVLDGEVLEQTEQQLVADEELSAAVDDAAAEVARNNPLISRSNARRLVIAWIYLVCWVGLVSLAASPAPTIFSIILAAAGADASRMGTIAGEAFEKLFPPTDGDSPHTDASNPES